MAPRTLLLTPWSGSSGIVETIASGPPVGVLTAISDVGGFSGAGTVAAAVSGVLAAAAVASAFAGAGTSAGAPTGINGVLAAQAQAAGFTGAGASGSNGVLAAQAPPAGFAGTGVALPSANRVAHFTTRYGDDTTHLTTSGGSRVTQFVNQDGGAAWAQGTAGNQATWEADSLVSSLNGLPSVHPDGGDYYLGTDAAVLSIAQTNSDHTVYIVASPDTALQYGTFFSWGNSASASGYLAYGIDVTGVVFGSSTAAFRLGTTVLTNKRPRVFAFKRTGDVLKVWIDGVPETLDGAGAFAVGALASVNRAALFTRCRSTNDLRLTGQAGEVMVYNTAHSDAQVVAESQALYDLWQLGHDRLVTLGDSLSNGSLSVSGTVLANRVALSSNGGKWQRYSGSTNGYTTTDMQTVFAARVTARRRWTAARDVLHIWGGTNDAYFFSEGDAATSATAIYTRITNLISSAKALGYKVVISTEILRADSYLQGTGAGPVTTNAILNALNVKIIANAAGADAVYDACGVLIAAGADANSAPNTYYSDTSNPGTHLTDLGYNLLAGGQGTAIDTQG